MPRVLDRETGEILELDPQSGEWRSLGPTAAGKPPLTQTMASGIRQGLEAIPRGIGQAGFETAGGIVGAGLGSALGPAGTLGGMGLGAAAGHQIESLIARGRGREPRGPGQVAMQSTQAGLIEPAAAGAGALAGAAGRFVGGGGIKKLLGGGTPKAAEGLRAMKAAGAPLSAGPVTGSPGMMQTQEAMSRMLGASGALNEVAEETNKALSRKVMQAARKGAGERELAKTPLMAGDALKKGLTKGKQAFSIKARQLYSKLDELVPKNTEVRIDNMVKAIHKPSEKFAGTPYEEFASEAVDSPIFRRWMEKLDNAAIKDEAGNVTGYKAMTWEQTKDLRTKVGSLLKQPMLTPDIDRAHMEMLYAALSEDMKEAAARKGGPAALEAFETANNYWKGGINAIRENVDKKLLMDSEKLFASVERGTSGDINKIKSFVPSGAWQDVRAEVARKMGFTGRRVDVGEEEFQPLVFMRRWQEMTPEKKQALFGSYRRAPGIVDELDTVAKAADRIKDMKSFSNPSGTAGNTWAMSILGGALGLETFGPTGSGAVPLATAVGGSYAVAKALTNPKFVKWLAQANRFKTKTNGFASHVGRLAAMKFDEEELDEVRDTVVNTFEQLSTNWDIPKSRTAFPEN